LPCIELAALTIASPWVAAWAGPARFRLTAHRDESAISNAQANFTARCEFANVAAACIVNLLRVARYEWLASLVSIAVDASIAPKSPFVEAP
jgi:hypothetical protein